jgi:Ca-activated chloride channel family protein
MRALREEARAHPDEDGALAEGDKALGRQVEALPEEDKALGRQVEALSGEDKALGRQVEALSGEDKAIGRQVEALPEEDNALAEEDKALPGEVKALPGEVKALPGEVKALPTEAQALPDEVRAVPDKARALRPPVDPAPGGVVTFPDLTATKGGTVGRMACLGRTMVSASRVTKWACLFLLALVVSVAGDGRMASAQAEIVSGADTFAEMRTVKGDVTITPVGEGARAPYPRERIAEGEAVTLAAGGLAWLRRDGGAVLLVAGPAKLLLHAASIEIAQGRAFVDTNDGPPAVVDTPHGHVELSDARASVDVRAGGEADVYVLRGSARVGTAVRAGPGERLSIAVDGTSARAPEVAWDDWTGGLATADAASEPAPFGIGTVGARPPGDKGKPRFSLVVQRLDVRVSIDHDFAVTEVDETFVNPSTDVVEGLFSFRTPPGAVLQRFGVDRNGDLVWGKVKESAAALAQYESNVYQGSTEDPALLMWTGPGVYSARLYPIAPGAQRRVVTRYTEWLPRQGPKADRRLYVYPMAAEGARGSLPRIEELSVSIDLARAGAQRVRAGMGGTRDGAWVVVKAFDVVPLADLAVELFDAGQKEPVAFRAPHGMTAEDAPEQAEAGFVAKVSREEPDYLLVPVRTTGGAPPPPGIDLAIVVDTSAATEAGALSVARSLAQAMLAQLGPDDRAALWAGDAKLHAVVDGSGALTALDDGKRRAWLEGLAAVERGGATDLGALLTDAATELDPKRRGAVVYIGDGQPSVGEIAPKALRDRLAHLPAGTRVFTAALGSRANVPLLQGVARGAPVELVGDAYGAARTALRLLEAAYRPTWVGATVDLGPGIERVLPRELPAVGADEGVLVVGRIVGSPPGEVTIRGDGQTLTQSLHVLSLADGGDLRRRWGQGRLAELLEEGAGRAAVVDVGRRYGLVSPFTSLYVPTARETETVDVASIGDLRDERRHRWKPWWHGSPSRDAHEDVEVAAASVDNKEGGTGTRAKGEEGSMGNPSTRPTGNRYGAPSPADDPSRQAALEQASQFGMIGVLSGAAPNAPPRPDVEQERGNAYGSVLGADLKDSNGAPGAGLGLSGIGGGAAVVAAAPLARKATAAPTATARPSPNDPLAPWGNVVHAAGQAVDHGSGNAVDIPKRLDGVTSPDPPPVGLATVGHGARPCGAAADLPFEDRRVLWGERLASTSTASQALEVYRRALADCEAPGWRERTTLLVTMVGRLGSVRERVALWRGLLGTAAADVVYRAIVVRVQTADDLKALHDALGLRSVDPDLLAGLLAKAKTPADRLPVLRAAALRWPDDLELSLRVLDAYEDAGDDPGGRAWARRIRHRSDATAHVYTNVGEYYLRLSHRESGPPSDRDADEARRTFGELVEFAPDDPVARRRLGDLLRAHGWYDEAFRQYETLAQLTPDDPAVPLLLAAAAQGMGRIEEAVSWAEKAASAGSPDGTSPVSRAARATASAFLSWARDEAVRAKRSDDAERLRARARRVAGADVAPAGSVRFLVTWAHPELHPVLWTSALGAPMPSTDSYPLYGVAQAVLPASPDPFIELRLDPEDAARAARLGAVAVVTALVAEGTPDERIVRLEVSFADPARGPLALVRVRLQGDALHTEVP